MADEKICFPPHRGVPYQSQPPTIDGFIEPEVQITSDKASDEAGYRGSARLTYASSSGIPQMVFQGVKDNSDDYLYLSFIARFDEAFDTFDMIVLIFAPNFNPAAKAYSADTRRIDIFPVNDDVGAGTAPDDGSPYKIRKDRFPRQRDFYRWNESKWVSTTEASNVETKVRSWVNGGGAGDKNWSVEIKIPVKGGASWVDLGTSFGFYYNLIRVSAFETPDHVIEEYTVQYTWPRGRIISDPASGAYASPADFIVPASYLGEATFGAAASCEGVQFAAGTSSVGVRDPANPGSTAPLLTNIDAQANNTFVARVKNTHPSQAAQQVHATFRIANWGVNPSNPNLWTLIPPPAAGGTVSHSLPKNIPSGGSPVELTVDWTPSNPSQYAEPNDHQCIWVILDSEAAANFSESSITRNMDFVNASVFKRQVEVNFEGVDIGRIPQVDPGDDRAGELLLVASRIEMSSAASYEGWDPSIHIKRPPAGGIVRPAPITLAEANLLALDSQSVLRREIFQRWGDQSRQVSTAILIMNGYRRIGLTLTLGGKQHQIYEPVEGYSYVASHVGRVKAWQFEIESPLVKPVSLNRYIVKEDIRKMRAIGAAPRRTTTFTTRLEAIEAEDDRPLLEDLLSSSLRSTSLLFKLIGEGLKAVSKIFGAISKRWP